MGRFTTKLKVWNSAEPARAAEVGAHTLESLGLTLDPVQKKLVPIAIAAALAVTGEENG